MDNPLTPALRAMVWKEVKENARWAALAMIGLALALVFTIAHQMGGNPANSLSAVWDSAGQVMTFGAPLVGLALGLLQILPELRRDQWAFLVHRPAPRATLFWGKALAGMGLTFLATLIPLLCLALWAQAPGHLPAPFDPRLLLGGLAAILTGLVFHAAGLLTALRPARWYGSRALPVAAAIVCALLVSVMPEFFEAVLATALFLAVLLTAARGSFLTTGSYPRQPRPARFGLGLALYVGLVGTLIAAAGLILSTVTTLFPQRLAHRSWTEYVITRTGHILRITTDNETVVRATDLSGHPVTLPTSANLLSSADFLQEQPLYRLWQPSQEKFSSPLRYALPLYLGQASSNDELWYYVPSRGQVLAYSPQTRRLLGSLGHNGFQTDVSRASRFQGMIFRTAPDYFDQRRMVIASPHSVYLLNMHQRSVTPLLITSHHVRDVSETAIQYVPGLTNPDLGAGFVVTMDDQFSLFSSTGRPLFTLPREYALRTHPYVSIAMTPDSKCFFFRYSPGWGGVANRRLPSLVTEVTANGAIVARYVLPPIPSPPDAQPPLTASLFGLLSPPFVTVIAEALSYWGPHSDGNAFWVSRTSDPRLWLLLCGMSIPSGLLSAALAWCVGRRGVFTKAGQWAWTIGVFWLGLPGVLLLLSLREWPAREACPNCGRPRVVDRDRCEHCGAGFPGPTRDGTEIFEADRAAPPVMAGG